MSKSVDFWESQKKELFDLLEKRRELSERIHLLRVAIRQHEEKPYINPNAGKGSKAFARFGKRDKDLTQAERRIWQKERKQAQRESAKNKGE